VKECSAIIEQVLEKFYENIWAYANSDEKQNIIAIEQKYSRKTSPVRTLGLGKWINFYKESHMVNLVSKYLEIDNSAFDFNNLIKINDIRNKCTHEDYAASAEEATMTYESTIELLIKTRLITKEPSGISPIQETEKKEPSIYRIWGDKIRLFLASNPIFEIEEAFETDFGKFYQVFGRWEFVGVVIAEDRIHILLLEDPISSYHEDVIDDIYEKVAMIIKDRIRKNFPDLSGLKVEINVALNMSDWGEYSAEIDF
jgi:hypothetical protein